VDKNSELVGGHLVAPLWMKCRRKWEREVSFFVIRIIFETAHISCFTTCEQYQLAFLPTLQKKGNWEYVSEGGAGIDGESLRAAKT
jgi:hypothetical protein